MAFVCPVPYSVPVVDRLYGVYSTISSTVNLTMSFYIVPHPQIAKPSLPQRAVLYFVRGVFCLYSFFSQYESIFMDCYDLSIKAAHNKSSCESV